MVEVDSDISWISGVIFRKIDMCIVNESLHKIKHRLSGNCFKKKFQAGVEGVHVVSWTMCWQLWDLSDSFVGVLLCILLHDRNFP